MSRETTPMLRALKRGTLALAIAAAVFMLAPPESAAAQSSGPRWKVSANNSATVRVSAGESIQAALDAASVGTTIIVEAGVYEEQLRIKKSGITLRGQNGATIKPGTINPTNDCIFSGFGAAICIGSEYVVGGNPVAPEVALPAVWLNNITVTGFTIEGPTGGGIWADRVRNLVVARNIIRNTTTISLDLSNVQKFWVARNQIDSGTGFPTVFIGGPDTATDGRFVGNTVRGGQQQGLMIWQAKRIKIHNNTFAGNCYGVLLSKNLLEGGEEADVPTRITLSKNQIRNNGGPCNPLVVNNRGAGILLIGGRNIIIKKNNIVDNQPPAGETSALAAVVVSPLDPAPVERVVIEDNTLERNIYNGNAVDIVVAIPEDQRTVRRNECTASGPDTNWCSG